MHLPIRLQGMRCRNITMGNSKAQFDGLNERPVQTRQGRHRMKRKTSTGIIWAISILLLTIPAYASGASLQLDVSSAQPGGTAVATLILQDSADVESFSLSLDFSAGATLSLASSDYFTRGDYFPISPFGPAPQVDQNHYQTTDAGTKVYFSGFAPNGQSGAIGVITFKVSPEALVDDTHVLTLSGQYRSTTGSIELMPDQTATFFVTDTVPRYDVSPSVNGGNGSIAPGSVQTVNSGSTVQFTLTPDEGYEVNSIDGTCGGTLGNNVFTTYPVTADCSVIASFHIPTYMVIPSVDGGNGTINPNSVQIVNKNDTVQFTLTPDEDYEVNSVGGTCGGTLNGNTFTTTPVTGVCSVIASFRSKTVTTYFVTPNVDGGNGTISPNTIQSVNSGETTQFTLSPAEGYEVNTVKGTCGGSLVGNVFTTNNVFFDCTVIADFRLIGTTLYTVTTSVSGSGGTISPDSAQSVASGSTASFTLYPEDGYTVKDMPGGTCPAGSLMKINADAFNYTTGEITENCTVEAIFTASTDFLWNLFLPAILNNRSQ